RERERSRHVPIIFLTAFSRNEKLEFRGYSLGAVDYLIKPIEPEILLSKVSVFVELFKKTAQVKQQAAEIAQFNADLEQRVIERTAQLANLTTVLTQTNLILEKRNQELDQFVYVASHDLKSPLRAIANISQWLAEDLKDKLTDETQHQLELLQGRVHRMEKLIDGLLQYYRAGRVKMTSETVDIENLLKEVISLLTPPAEFTIEIEPGMPTLSTVRVLLEQVFTNLINNAIKHHHSVQGTVKISVQKQGNFYEFSVSDDGPGIAPQFHEKIFGLFQTLEPRAYLENTGIGLSLVKKIVESEAGTIAIDSQEGKGVTVRFTWPA
ncbi:MAG: sensor histidine kinase, partial [Microcystaceae cyanobacterium]